MTTQYADYSYYTSTFLGVLIASSTDFDRLALRASAHIDRLTFNRAAAEIDPANVDAIKMATCSVAEELSRDESSGGDDAIQSERVGDHSVTYVSGSSKSKTLSTRIAEAAKLYLENTFLMFPGFYTGEYGTLPIDDLL